MNFDLKNLNGLFDTTAENIAKEIFGGGKEPDTSKTQVRNFYEKLLEYHEMVFIEAKNFSDILPLIKMLNSKVAYAKGRKKIRDKFAEFMKNGVTQINSKEDLDRFKLLFEAVLGFFVGIEGERKGKN
ncbi:MAG: type III-A CRISPR-associated protein Csm2 [Campylobacterales bacterium]|nr:type III-A CRISPR-associated protein Csm2 [Campylobacterales bacterium]